MSLSRRSFLGSVAALPLIPAVSKGVTTRPSVGQHDTATVYGLSCSGEDAAMYFPTLDAAEDCRSGQSSYGITPQRAAFPGRWFFTASISWTRYFDWLFGAAHETGSARDRIVARAVKDSGRSRQQVLADMARFRDEPWSDAPTHELDLPVVITCSVNERWSAEPLSRSSALAEAAATNRERRALGSDWDGEWSVVLELSEPLSRGTSTLELAGEIGIERKEDYHAVRVIRPTAAEIARHTRRLS